MKSIEWARQVVRRLNPDDKYTAMLFSMGVITKMLEEENIKPIIVGGFSVEIYTNRKYSTRDVDIATNKKNRVIQVMQDIGFETYGRHLVYKDLELMVEIPSDTLAGSYNKINKIYIDDNNELYVYVISYEDIIMDRLRAYLYWNEYESKQWGMILLARYLDTIDINYMKEVGRGAERIQEVDELEQWLYELKELQ